MKLKDSQEMLVCGEVGCRPHYTAPEVCERERDREGERGRERGNRNQQIRGRKEGARQGENRLKVVHVS